MTARPNGSPVLLGGGRYLLVALPAEPEGPHWVLDLEDGRLLLAAAPGAAAPEGDGQGDDELRAVAAELAALAGTSPALDQRLADWRAALRPARPTAAGAAPSAQTAALLAELHSPDPDLRASAAARLGRLGDPAGVAPLLARLEDEDPDVRRYAADALGRLGDSRARGPLQARLQDPDAWVREWAAGALHRLGEDPRALGYAERYTYVDDEGDEHTVPAAAP